MRTTPPSLRAICHPHRARLHKRVRTADGVGVGSTEAEVKRKVRGVKCSQGGCRVGRDVGGATVTDFGIKNGEVSWVALGKVFD